VILFLIVITLAPFWQVYHHEFLLDGSNVEEVVPGLDAVGGIALDPAGGHIWWTEYALGKIYRADLDGSNVQDIVQGLAAPTGIGFAEANGKIYWLSVAPPEVPATSAPGLALLVLLLLGGSSALLAWRRLRARAHRAEGPYQ
jgi:hypothetical protein